MSIAKTATGICGICRCFCRYFARLGRFLVRVALFDVSHNILTQFRPLRISFYGLKHMDGFLMTFAIVELMGNYRYNRMWCSGNVMFQTKNLLLLL